MDLEARMLDLACRCWDHRDHPDRPAETESILAGGPWLSARSPHIAAAVGDPSRPACTLTEANANQACRPRDWPPILYLAFTRVSPADTYYHACLRLLLDRGADPNSHFSSGGTQCGMRP